MFRTSGAVHEPKITTSFSNVSRFSKLRDSKDALVLLGCPSPGIFEYPFSSTFVAARSLAYNAGPDHCADKFEDCAKYSIPPLALGSHHRLYFELHSTASRNWLERKMRRNGAVMCLMS